MTAPAQDVGGQTLLLLPRKRRGNNIPLSTSFVIFVLLPSMVMAAYFSFYASSQYTSEFRFSVMQSSPVIAGQAPPTSSAPGGSQLASGIAAIVGGGSSMGGASSQNFLIADYISSREALTKVQEVLPIRRMFSAKKIDYWSRLPEDASDEELFQYWQSMVYTNYDQVTGLARVQVKAFEPKDAFQIAKQLVKQSEALINEVSNRSNIDAVTFASDEVVKAQNRLANERLDLAMFRMKEGVIDPTTSVIPGNSTQLNAFETTLATLTSQQFALLDQGLSKSAPTAKSLAAQIAGVNATIAHLKSQIPTGTAGATSLVELTSRYEKINLQIQFDQSMLVSTQQALDQARAIAAAQHLYLTPYVRPKQINTPTSPKRLQASLLGFLAFLFLWLMALTLLKAVREHAH